MSKAGLKVVEATQSAKKPAILYGRVSDKKQANKQDGGRVDPFTDDKYSLETQVDACATLARELGYPLDNGRVFKEVYTGFELFDRPKLNETRELIRSGNYGALICHAVDRLVRKASHYELLAEECERYGVELLFVLDKPEDNAIGRFTMSARAFAAEFEREKIKERTMRGKLAKMRAGKFVNGGATYGFRLNNHMAREIDESQAEVIKEIFDVCAKKRFGCQKIAQTLNDKGILTPTGKGRWVVATVHRILTRTDYKGEVTLNKSTWVTQYDKGKKKQKQVARDEKDVIRLTCPAIVSEELWDEAQQVLKSNTATTTRNLSRPALLRGMIFCGKCSHRMYVSAHNNKERPNSFKPRYRCESSRRLNLGIKCGGSTIQAYADEWAWSQVVEHMSKPEVIIDKLQQELDKPLDPQLKVDVETLRAHIKKCEEGQRRLVKALVNADDEYVAETIERELAAEGKKKVQFVADAEFLETRIRAQETKRNGYKLAIRQCKQFADRLATATMFEQRRMLFEILCVRVKFQDKKLSITWRFNPETSQTTPEEIELATTDTKACAVSSQASKAREIVKFIKDSKLRVQSSINGDFVRVGGKDRDTLQQVISLLKEKDFGIDMQFTNYRS